MAQAFFELLAPGHEAISAGSEPADAVHPSVIAAMKEVGIDLSGAKPRSMDSVPLRLVSRLVTMGCGDDACPVAPGVEVEDWPLPDPKGKPIDDVRRIRDEIEQRVTGLIHSNGWRT